MAFGESFLDVQWRNRWREAKEKVMSDTWLTDGEDVEFRFAVDRLI